ncbi:MAG TPA: alpha/beta hydrolase [Actinocrinis sp.]|nr:alpha/beta hydrolase [Actinocrinis sp.]
MTSADGTRIGYRELGAGQPVILVHGGMQASQHLMKLARTLSDQYTVYLPDRRGRGLSGPHGADFSILREVEDLQALIAATGSTRVFGLSSGALVALRTALATPGLGRVALYEPPLSVGGSAPVDWVPRFDREIAAGKPGSAVVTALKGTRVDPAFARIPRFALAPLLGAGMRAQRGAAAGDVPIVDLVPTQHYDMQLVREMADTVGDYRTLKANVLLLGGTKSPRYLTLALDTLAAALPRTRRITFTGLGHCGPDDDGDPRRVAETVRDFFW